jgi:hypothetical protein
MAKNNVNYEMGGIYVGKSMDIALGRVVVVPLGAPQNIKKE